MLKTSVRPPRLVPGDAIGVVSPAKWSEEPALRRAAALFERAGHRVVLGQSNFAREGQFAGSAASRARDLERMFADPAVKAVFCARGGYTAAQVAEALDFSVLARNPKIFAGFSDITALLLSIAQKTGLVTFHGPMLYTFGDGPESLSFDTLLGVLYGKISVLDLLSGAGEKPRVLVSGRASGPLVGGNLTLLVDRLGTPDDFDSEGAVLFVEEVKEPVYKIHRMFEHLRRADKFSRLAALVVGEMTDFPPDEIPFGAGVDEIALASLGPLAGKIPVLSGAACGHGRSLLTFPVGLPVEVDFSPAAASLRFVQPPVL